MNTLRSASRPKVSTHNKWATMLAKYGPAIILALVATQYIRSAFTFHAQIGSVYWGLGAKAEAQAGVFRYFKDAAVFSFGLVWPFYIHQISRAYSARPFPLGAYIAWLTIILAASLFPFLLFDGTSPVVIPGGLRWMLGLHAALGTYLVFLYSPPSPRGEKFITITLIAILCLDLYFVSRQGNIFNLARAQGVRLPGMFSVAGAAGYFALACGLFTYQFRTVSMPLKLALFVLALIVAFWSGTRYALIGLMAIMVTTVVTASAQSSEKAAGNKPIGPLVAIASIMALLPVAIFGAIELTFRLGRGNPFEQNTRGGRLWNLNQVLEDVSNSNILEIFLGRGLGTGTNSSFPLLTAAGIDPDSVKWNILIDNTFVTTFFQVGLFGLALFAIGLANALPTAIWRRNLVVTLILAMGLFTQNILEQVSLLIGFAVAYSTTERERLVSAGNVVR